MEKVVDNLSFNGNVARLVIAIGKKGINISPLGSMDTGEALAVDFKTQVHVNEKNKKVRFLLTNSVPIEGRGRILWYARTGLGKRKTTFVRYLG